MSYALDDTPVGGSILDVFEHKTLHERLADHLEALILAGEFQAGLPIPSERDLAVRLGVSRTAVRDATRLLAARGLVEVRQGIGTLVTSDGKSTYQSALDLLLRRGGYRRLDLLDLRRLIETELAARLAEHPTPVILQQLERELDAMRQAVQTCCREDVEAHHLRFHLILADAADNRVLREVFGPLVRLTFELTMSTYLLTHLPCWEEYSNHVVLLERIAAGDAEGARQATRSHLDAALFVDSSD